jgi:predicted nuclease of predicted toxin-antitoxin system
VNVLLDENFPLQLYRHLRKRGLLVEHILLQKRGIPDSAIRDRLAAEPQVVFLTQDTEFLDLEFKCQGRVIVSRVRQSLPIAERVEVWLRGLDAFLAESPLGRSSSSSNRVESCRGRSIGAEPEVGRVSRAGDQALPAWPPGWACGCS